MFIWIILLILHEITYVRWILWYCVFSIFQLWNKLGPNSSPTTQARTKSIQNITTNIWIHIRFFLLLNPSTVPVMESGVLEPSPICSTRRLTVGKIINRASRDSRDRITLWVTVVNRVETDTGRRKVTGGSCARIRELHGSEYASPPSSGVEWRHKGQEIEGGLLGSGGWIRDNWILWRHSVQKTWRHSSIRGSLRSWSYSW